MVFRFSSISDNEVIEKIRKGDEKVIEYLYKKHFRMMANLITKNNGTENDAKDIFQDALIVFWKKVISGDLVLTSKISTYLYSICQNLWRKELERKNRYSNEEKDGVIFEDHDQAERIAIVRKCIDELGETCKKVLTLFYFEELSMDDIAVQLGFANADTAKTKKYKCKLELDKKVKSKFSTIDFFD